jgi:hypothetical protein
MIIGGGDGISVGGKGGNSNADTDASANDKDDYEEEDGISVRGNGDDSNANTDASANDKDDNEGGDGISIRGKGDDSNADDKSPSVRDEKASGATDNEEKASGATDKDNSEAYLGIFQIPKTSQENSNTNSKDEEGVSKAARETDMDDEIIILGKHGSNTSWTIANDVDSSSDKEEKPWNGNDNLDIKKSSDDSSSLLSDDFTLSSLKRTSSNDINEDATGLVNSSSEDDKQDGHDGPKMNVGKAKLNKKMKADGEPKKTAAGGSKTGNSSTPSNGASKKDTQTLKEQIDALARKRAKTALSLSGANNGREPSRKISKASGEGMNKGKGISNSGNKVSTEVKITTTAIRGKPLYTKRPVERNVSQDDHDGEKLARETRMTNTTEDATTEMKTTTSKTNAIGSKNKPINRITDIASKPPQKDARPRRILYYIMIQEQIQVVPAYLKPWILRGRTIMTREVRQCQ